MAGVLTHRYEGVVKVVAGRGRYPMDVGWSAMEPSRSAPRRDMTCYCARTEDVGCMSGCVVLATDVRH